MILFVGNFLTKHGYNLTFIEILSISLKVNYEIKLTSNKRNQIIRIFDMIYNFYISIIKTNLVIIDLYSTRAYYFGLFFSILSKIHHKPYIVVLSGGGLKNKYKKSMTFKFILNNSKANISPSKYLYDVFSELGYKVHHIPNFIDLNLYPFRKRKVIKPKILWVRAIHEIYNPLMAVKVIKVLREKHPLIHLCMVGPYKDKTINKINKAINKDRLNKNIVTTGRLTKEEWINLSKEYDIFINTTNFDNHPVSLLEAMALGLPIISTNVGGIPFLIKDGETGFLVDENDHINMAQKIDKLISNELEGYEVSLRARDEVTKIDKNNIIPQWEDLIEKSLI